MDSKQPVILIVLIETNRLRWFAAGLALNGEASPLICSDEEDLAPYLTLEFDEQTAFLRHRLGGVLQRGCNLLWAKNQKPRQLAFVADGLFTRCPPQLTQRIAEHFVEWMTNPPVVFYVSESGFRDAATIRLTQLAGDAAIPIQELLMHRLPELFTATFDPTRWELLPRRPS